MLLAPISIGNITLKDPVILAPMSGVTDLPFRKLVKKIGTSMVVSEMIASRAMIAQAQKSIKRADIIHDDEMHAVQLAGNEPHYVAEAAKMVADMGAKIIDINFGCPAKKITNGFAGSALMKDPCLAAKILEQTVKAVSIPVTLKMRLGWNAENINAPLIARIAEESGIQMLTVHGRTRCQMYNGKADWHRIREVKESTSLPLIVNGDIKTAQDARDAVSASSADGVMIGRATYGKPWLMQQITDEIQYDKASPTPSLEEQHRIITEHYTSMLEYYGKESGMRQARKHISWYSAGIPGSASFRAAINNCSDADTAIQSINQFYRDAINAQESHC